MAKIVIRDASGVNEVKVLAGAEFVIGRHRQADIMLPNVSVSRQHAKLTWENREWILRDLDSRNGVDVNGKRVQEHPLVDGDRIKIGTFELVFVEDTVLAEVDGTEVNTMMPYRAPATLPTGSESTFALSAAELKLALQVERLKTQAHLVGVGGEKWLLGEGTTQLGGELGVPLSGVLLSAEAGEVVWDGRVHVLSRASILNPIRVNGNRVKSHTLRLGDKVRIGKTEFVYQLVFLG